ncbi:hypothetical protein FF38_02614 [Lucilia cuprina]|uniref:Uncharacterized protein n=1 Tax=Lucilia cuprina TaxID=7375 RepID=A0A0L0CNZ3_LUCCU|nr:hypothetical protein FF38_02614 [Lucilia cuprina]
MSDRERSSPTLIETGLKNLIGGRDGNYPLISGINGKAEVIISTYSDPKKYICTANEPVLHYLNGKCW